MSSIYKWLWESFRIVLTSNPDVKYRNSECPFFPQWTSNLQCQPQLGPLRSPINKVGSEEKAFSACTSKSPAPPVLLRGCPTPSKLHPPTPHSVTTPSVKTLDTSMGSDPSMEQLVPERDTNPGTRLTVDMCSSSSTVQESISKAVVLSQENQSCNLKMQHRWVVAFFISNGCRTLGWPAYEVVGQVFRFAKRWISVVWKYLQSWKWLVKQSYTSWQQTLDTGFIFVGIQFLVPHWVKYLNVKWWLCEGLRCTICHP
jgi:hypothetical protein